MNVDYRKRTRLCQEYLFEANADCLVCFPGPNLQYLTGFSDEPMERHLLLFVPHEDEAVFLAPTMYAAQLADTHIADVRLWDDGEDPREEIGEVLSTIDPDRLLVDDRLWARFTQDLRAVTDAEFGLASEILTDLRITKEETEIDAIRRVSALTDRVSEEVRDVDFTETTERELAREIDSKLAEAGGEGPSFETIVASGPSGAHPHHRHSDREITAGDPVVLDFGTRVDGYPSDQTRTHVFSGEPSEKFEEVHEVVCEAQQAAVEAAEPGIPAGEVDRAAREVIERAGYGVAFTHRTGHGVGIEVHEPPYIVAGNTRKLEPGMVFSVEPGIYLEGEFGVRTEDLVVVTETGCERLNGSSRRWR